MKKIVLAVFGLSLLCGTIRAESPAEVHDCGVAAVQGPLETRNNFGVIYADAQAQNKDNEESIACYRLMAAEGLAVGQNNLGIAYATGWGVEKNDALAFNCYRLAALQGLLQAQYNLGTMYENGQGVERNYDLAL